MCKCTFRTIAFAISMHWCTTCACYFIFEMIRSSVGFVLFCFALFALSLSLFASFAGLCSFASIQYHYPACKCMSIVSILIWVKQWKLCVCVFPYKSAWCDPKRQYTQQNDWCMLLTVFRDDKLNSLLLCVCVCVLVQQFQLLKKIAIKNKVLSMVKHST